MSFVCWLDVVVLLVVVVVVVVFLYVFVGGCFCCCCCCCCWQLTVDSWTLFLSFLSNTHRKSWMVRPVTDLPGLCGSKSLVEQDPWRFPKIGIGHDMPTLCHSCLLENQSKPTNMVSVSQKQNWQHKLQSARISVALFHLKQTLVPKKKNRQYKSWYQKKSHKFPTKKNNWFKQKQST